MFMCLLTLFHSEQRMTQPCLSTNLIVETIRTSVANQSHHSVKQMKLDWRAIVVNDSGESAHGVPCQWVIKPSTTTGNCSSESGTIRSKRGTLSTTFR